MAKITLKEAITFHGHLGPYLVLGLKAGELILKKLGAKKYFGLYVKVYGATLTPKSCLVDGLQLSTGATYGKGNIEKFSGEEIRMEARCKERKGALRLRLNADLIKKLDGTKTHHDAEALAKKLFTANHSQLFLVRS